METDPVQFAYKASERTFFTRRKAGVWDIFVLRTNGDVYRVTDGTLSDVFLFLEHSERFVSGLREHIDGVRSLVPRALEAGDLAIRLLRQPDASTAVPGRSGSDD